MRKFSKFFKENYSLVLTVAEHRLGSFHDAEEIATEAFRIAWASYTDGEDLSVPWLYGVVRNLIGNEYRSRDRRAALEHRVSGELMVGDPGTGDLYSDVRDLVGRMPSDHREVLQMTYWDELSAPEVAAVLEITPVAVRARLTRARRALRALLVEMGYHGSKEARLRG